MFSKLPSSPDALLLFAVQLAGPDYAGLAVREAQRDPCRLRESSEVVMCGRSRARLRYSAPIDVHGNVLCVMRALEVAC